MTLQTYTALVAADIGAYGWIDVEAENIAEATEKIIALEPDCQLDPEWDGMHSRRIVSITDANDNYLAENISLDADAPKWLSAKDRQLLDSAPDLLAALQKAMPHISSRALIIEARAAIAAATEEN